MSVSIPYLLLLAAENVFLFRLLHAFAGAAAEEVQAIYFLMDMNYLYVLGFLFFLFISCEFMRKSREVNLVESMRERAWIVEGNQFAVLGTLCTGGCFYFAYAADVFFTDVKDTRG